MSQALSWLLPTGRSHSPLLPGFYVTASGPSREPIQLPKPPEDQHAKGRQAMEAWGLQEKHPFDQPAAVNQLPHLTISPLGPFVVRLELKQQQDRRGKVTLHQSLWQLWYLCECPVCDWTHQNSRRQTQQMGGEISERCLRQPSTRHSQLWARASPREEGGEEAAGAGRSRGEGTALALPPPPPPPPGRGGCQPLSWNHYHRLITFSSANNTWETDLSKYNPIN